jgi:hypothetical protein
MGQTDETGPRHEPLPLAFGDGNEDLGPEDRLPGDDDPRAKWRTMPRPVMPDEWVGEHDNDPVPDSVRDAEANRESREARWLIERGGGLGG